MNTIHVNFWGGPGLGKSTTASDVFTILKKKHLDVEIITEYAKELVWEQRYDKLNNQVHILGEQLDRHIRLEGKVRFLITDSPFPMGCVYDQGRTKYLKEIAFSEFNKLDNINFLIKRIHSYNPNGRMQNEDEAIEKDNQIKALLDEQNVEYIEIDNRMDINSVIDLLVKEK